MRSTCAALRLCALLCAASRAAPLPAPPAAPPCERLAARHAERHGLLAGDRTGREFRSLVMNGSAVRPVVWGAASAEGAAEGAAAALLHAALRYGLGYDATLRRQHFNFCRPDFSQLAVAPVAHACPDDGVSHPAGLSGGASRVAQRAPPLARLAAAAAAACGAPRRLPADDYTALRLCGVLTLHDFEQLSSQLPRCEYSPSSCPGERGAAAGAAVAVLAAAAPAALRAHVCGAKLALRFLKFNDTACFNRTLQYLYSTNISFIFLDRDSWMNRADLVPVDLRRGPGDAGCPARDLNYIHRGPLSVGDGTIMKDYAPQIADVVEGFCPLPKHLKEVLTDTGDIETSACKWALRNRNTFESWIATVKRKYKLYIFTCTDDPLNSEYDKTISKVQNVIAKRDFHFSTYTVAVDCSHSKSVYHHFLNILKNDGADMMGAVGWSASAGAAEVAHLADRECAPLALAGPAPARARGSGAGSLAGLAAAYRAFLTACEWSRVAILSDGSSYAHEFTDSLLREGGIDHVEKTITTETASSVLRSLREDDARVFIVNANSTTAERILQTAIRLGLTPPHCAWLVREWSPAGRGAEGWGAMSHYVVGAAWRGAAGGAREPAGGDAALRGRLRALWPGAPWPALAAPLADAMLLVVHTFAEFYRLYSSNPQPMCHRGYAMRFSQIVNKINVAGVATELGARNSSVEAPLLYLERWRGTERVELTAWRPRDRAGGAGELCAPRVRDRPRCAVPAGGAAFVRRCYDAPLGALAAALALLPGALLLARRARLKRLALRDVNLLARIFDTELTATMIPRDSLQIHKKIGAGNFGCVYLATLLSRGKSITVAAKALLDDADKEEYLREARTLQQLDHKNIVKFVGVCVSKGSLLILMEYAPCGDLHAYLAARRGAAGSGAAARVSAAALTRLAREAAAALRYLAARGLVHRDVRAANCLLDRRRTLKLADFGMARRLARDCAEYTSARHALFPVLWMAPESLERGTFSTASDVWALGVLCLELATLGRRPYGAQAPQRVLAYVRAGGHPPLPPDITDRTRLLLTACWQRQATERPSAGDVARFLAREPRALRPALLPAPEPALPPFTRTQHKILLAEKNEDFIEQIF